MTENLKYELLDILNMELGTCSLSIESGFRNFIELIDKNKLVQKEEIVRTKIKTGDLLRLGLEELGRKYNKTQREILIAAITYGARNINRIWGEIIKNIYRKRDVLYKFLVNCKDKTSYEWILANRILESLKVYVNNMQNIKAISLYCFRRDYEYLGGVARALGSDFSCIARLAIYITLDAEHLLIPDGVIDAFNNSVKVMNDLLDYVISEVGLNES